jgi:hypothetical protein
MPLSYAYTAIPEHVIPVAAEPLLQPALDTYASETNKVASVWREFRDEDLVYRPHERASTVGDILKHQLLSERRFFGEFLGVPEPPPKEVLPPSITVPSATDRLVELAMPRLAFLAGRRAEWWMAASRSSTSSGRVDLLASRASHGAPPHGSRCICA